MKLLIVLSCIIWATTGISDEESWHTFKTKYNKTYENKGEEEERFKIFQDNLRVIADHNAKYETGKVTWYMGVNKFADWTEKEFLKYYHLDVKHPTPENVDQVLIPKPQKSDDIPESFDWRDENFVFKVKDQGNCGSCWAFMTTGVIEAKYTMTYDQNFSLSEQNLVDCSFDYGNHGCNGGEMPYATQYIIENGIELEEDYPYTGSVGDCRADPSKNFPLKVTGSAQIESGNEDALKHAIISHGPIACSLDATSNFYLYTGGVFYDLSCSSNSHNHGMLAIGYGNDDGVEYWIMKNSWGADWGENGYMRMSRNKNNQCGIATYANYPILD